MTDAILIAAIVAVPPTIAAVANLLQSRKNGAKASAIIVKADEIHELTNSNLTRVKEELAAATARIEALEAMILRLTERDSNAERRH